MVDRNEQARRFMTGFASFSEVIGKGLPTERPASGSLAYDPTLPKPGFFDEWYGYYYKDRPEPDPEYLGELREAYAAGWEAAITEHEC